MIKQRSLVAALAFCAPLLSFCECVHAQRGPTCEVPELVSNNERYNTLVCQGVGRLHSHDPGGAISALEAAMQIRFAEVPNFQLFPRLALAYWQRGDTSKARQTMRKAQLSLLVLIGADRCEETGSGFHLVNRYGEPIEGESTREIAQRMCGEAYAGVYDTNSLEDFAKKARLVTNYFAIADSIGVR